MSVNLGMMAAVLLCDGPQFVEVFHRLFFQQESPPVNQISHESAERNNPVSHSSPCETVQHPKYPGEGGVDPEYEDTVNDSVENLGTSEDDEDDNDKENEEQTDLTHWLSQPRMSFS